MYAGTGMDNDAGAVPRAGRPRGRLVISAAALSAAALAAGCASGQAPGAPGPIAASIVAPPTLASIGPSSSPGHSAKAASPSRAPARGRATASPSSSPTGRDPATPSPTPTTSSASPPPTGSGGWSCVTSAAKGSCGPYSYPRIQGTSSNPTVNNNVWSPISGWQETLYSNNPGSWSVTANMPAGNTAVVSYPSSGSNYNDRALSSFSTIDSSFSETMNPVSGTSAEAAYDVWLNNWANEVMIQHDIVNRGSCPVLATASFGGSRRKWNLCKYGSELIWQLAGSGERSGTVDILSMLTWLQSHGYLPGSSTLTSIGYGWEICSTGGVNEDFQVTSYSITAA